MRGNGWLLAVAAAVAVSGLAGCASVDRFSGHMTTFNSEAEHTQDQAIMLNVLRAAAYRPLSFTELQSFSDTVTPSASLSLSAPLAQNGSMTPTTLSPTLGVTGGPTISASYIGTQDFYRGILTPLPMSTIDLLVQRRIPSTVLFDLLFSKIIVRQAPNSSVDDGKLAEAEVFTAINDPAHADTRLTAYQDLVEALLNEGLTTGAGKSEAIAFGPLLTDSDLSADDRIAKAATAGLKVEEVEPCDLTEADALSLTRRTEVDFLTLTKAIKPECKVIGQAEETPNVPKAPIDAAKTAIFAAVAKARAPLVYRLVKAGDKTDPRFCMTGPRSPDGLTHVPAGNCQSGAAAKAPPAEDGKYKLRITAQAQNEGNEQRLCEALNETAKSGAALDCSHGEWLANGLDVDLEPRSTYSIIYYLGELERRERRGEPPLLIKAGDVMTAIPAAPCRSADQVLSSGPNPYRCQTLFYMREGSAPSRSYLSVVYDGRTYAVPDNEVEAGKTNEVLDILNELIALNHSAKDAPASSLITVVGVH
jgi:hypothetical protein